MASLRGGQVLWGSSYTDDDSEINYTTATVGGTDISPAVVIGSGPYVVVYIDNSMGSNTNATFKIQVSAGDDPRPGLNGNGENTAWFDLNGSTSIVVDSGDTVAYDLSPFGAPMFRLARTDSGDPTDLLAFVSSFGPN